MDKQAYAFNTATAYKVGGLYPVNYTLYTLTVISVLVKSVAPTDFTKTDITVRALITTNGSFVTLTSFMASFINVFDKYKVPLFKTDALVKTWCSAPMDWWQNQLNFAVWCATSGCGMSAQDHLQASEPLMRLVYLFHVYYTTRHILAEIQVPLLQDQAWSRMANPYDRRAYEHICNEFVVSPHTDWHVPVPNHGLGRVYFYAGGRYTPAYGTIDSYKYDPEKIFTRSTTSKIVHVDFVKQDESGANEAWCHFILNKSQGFTWAGVERLNDSIRTYVWALLGAQVQMRTGILGTSTAFDAQKQFVANVEDAMSSPADLPSATQHYQDVLTYARTEVNYAFGVGLYMSPSDMLLHVGQVAGYNNQIVIATSDQALGLNMGFNTSDGHLMLPMTPGRQG